MKFKRNFDNPEKICRLCLMERMPSKMKYLFQSKILNMMNCCFHFEVLEDHYSPSHICFTCLQYIVKFYNFQKRVQKNDRILKLFASRIKRRNILDIALNEAEISDGHSESNPIIQPTKQVDQSHSELTVSDSCSTNILRNEKKLTHTPNSEKTTNESSFNIQWKSQNIYESHKSSNKSKQNLEEGNIANNDEDQLNCHRNIILTIGTFQEKNDDGLEKSSPNILSGPPPLVPLLSIKVKDKITTDAVEEEEIESNVLNTKNDFPQNNLVCNICKKSFKEREKLIGHLKGHMVVKDHACKICGKKYPNPSTFRIHMRSHTGERPFLCPVCNKGFTRWAGVISHMPTHEDTRPFKCETCGKTFKISSNLERHKVLHSDILPFCCNYCGKTFSQSDNLQLHIRTHHTNEKPYLCSQCGKRFVSSARLNRHMWVHTNYKPFNCSSCSKAYSNSSDLKNHQQIVHGNGNVEKPFPCKFCEMRFFHPSRLSKHLETHKKPYACDECHKTFKTNVLFEKHVLSKHSSE